jgi:hypothetical protein
VKIARNEPRQGPGMGRIVVYLIVLLLLAAAAGAVYSVVADLPAPRRAVEIDLPARSLE